MDLSELQGHLNKIMHEQNNRGIAGFEGYSPFEMHNLLHFTMGMDSPVQFLKLSDEDYKAIPIFMQMKFFAELLANTSELKLTSKGFLPVKIVSELYDQHFIKDYYIESGMAKIYKEVDSESVHLTRILTELSGLAKKRNNKLSLTKIGSKTISDNYELFKLIFNTFASKFNWAYLDGFGENKIGQMGYGYSLILLSKYGNIKRPDSFYSEKYFKAFPQFKEIAKPDYDTIDSQLHNCYSIRTFERFLDYFGLIHIEKESYFTFKNKYITKSELFDKLIKCHPTSSFKK